MSVSSDAGVPDEAAGQPQVELWSESVQRTQRLGALLGALAEPGDIVLLDGDLGAGKTAFTQGIGQGLGVADIINSPTFTILKEYAGRIPLYHFDLYRIDRPEELFALGFEEYFGGDGVCVVEWAERGEPRNAGEGENEGADAVWPPDWLRVQFLSPSTGVRVLRCTARGRRGQALLAAVARAAVADEAG